MRAFACTFVFARLDCHVMSCRVVSMCFIYTSEAVLLSVRCASPRAVSDPGGDISPGPDTWS